MKNLTFALLLGVIPCLAQGKTMQTEKPVFGQMMCEIPSGAAEDYFRYETRYGLPELSESEQQVYELIQRNEGSRAILNASDKGGTLTFISAEGARKDIDVRMIMRTYCGGETQFGCGKHLLIGVDMVDSDGRAKTSAFRLPANYKNQEFIINRASSEELASTYRGAFAVNFRGIIDNNRLPHLRVPFAQGYFACEGKFSTQP